MSPAEIARSGATNPYLALTRPPLIIAALCAALVTSAAHAQCTTRNLGGGFVSYSCADGRSGTTVVPGGPGAIQGSGAPHLPSTNSGIGINKQLFGNKPGISQRVGPDRSIHLYGGRTGASVDRGGGITTHTGPAFESNQAAPPQAAPTTKPSPERDRPRPERRRR